MANLSQFFGDAVASGQSQYTTDPRILPVGVYYNARIKTWSNSDNISYDQNFWYMTIPRLLQMYNDQWTSVYNDYPWVNLNFKDSNAAGHTAVDNFEATNAAEIPGGYAIVDYATQADTWVDVCNHSGYGGYLSWVCGLGNYGVPVGSKSYIRITVDGQSYEFVGNLHYRNGATNSSHERLLWGSLGGASTTSNPWAGGMFGGSHSDFGTGDHNRTYYFTKNSMGVYTRPEEVKFLTMPDEALPAKGFTALRFENSIRVEVKIQHPNGSYAVASQGANTNTNPYFSNYAACALYKDLVLPGF